MCQPGGIEVKRRVDGRSEVQGELEDASLGTACRVLAGRVDAFGFGAMQEFRVSVPRTADTSWTCGSRTAAPSSASDIAL